ncbi:hypothetical protein BGP_4669 [Beggiatoa sp. PS]|nr:hypothetical protein BGP_4669 [Beggiatoa sp. PS]
MIQNKFDLTKLVRDAAENNLRTFNNTISLRNSICKNLYSRLKFRRNFSLEFKTRILFTALSFTSFGLLKNGFWSPKFILDDF